MIGKLKLPAITLLVTTLASIGLFSDANAAEYSERTEWGGRDISYYGDNDDLGYHRTLSGATWYYYKIKGTASEYSDNQYASVPVGRDNVDKTSIPLKTCASYGGFWALMRNEYRRTSESSGDLTGRPAAATKLSDIYAPNDVSSPAFTGLTNHIIYKNLSGAPEGEDNVFVQAEKFGKWEDVKKDFETYKNTKANPEGATWDTNSGLSYFCSGTLDEANDKADFISFSTVSMNENYTSAPVANGKGYLANSFIVPRDSSIKLTFRHYVAKSLEKPLTPADATISYDLSGFGEGGSGTVAVKDLTEHFNIGGIDYYAGAVSREVTITASSETTYCQASIFNGSDSKSYRLSNLEVISGGPTLNSSACVTIKPIDTSPTTVTSCDQGLETDPAILAENPIIAENGGKVPLVVGKDELGNTLATVGLSKNGVLQTTTAYNRNDTTRVFAKPGDAVQFSYAICFGAQNVLGDNGLPITRRDNENNRWNNNFEVQIGGKDSDDNARGLLFGRAEDLLGLYIEVSNNDTQDMKLNRKSFWIDGSKSSPLSTDDYYLIDNSKRQISFASPDDWSGNNLYDCKYYSKFTGSTAGTGTYQIPGFQSVDDAPDCNSARLTASGEDMDNYLTSLVGATLSQTMSYYDLTIWPTYLSGTGPFDKNASNNGGSNGGAQWGERPANVSNFYDAYQSFQSGHHSPSGVRRTSNNQTLYKTASVVIPYNFDTALSAEINNVSGSYVYPGDKVSISADVDILPRVNPLTSDSTGNDENNSPLHDIPYATITPSNTRVELVQFVVRDDADINNETTTYTYNDGINESVKKPTLKGVLNGETDVFTKGTICSMYTGYLGSLIGECKESVLKGYEYNQDNNKEMSKIGNPDSNPAGEMDYYHVEGDELTRIVPDVEAGYKYCVAIAINHGDSHGVSGQPLSADPGTAENPNPNYAANSFSVLGRASTSVKNAWKVTPASCRTVAKKPNFQIWNGGVYSAGDINTSISNPTVNTKLGENENPDVVLPSNLTPEQKQDREAHFATNSIFFGSWAEYFVAAKGTIRNFASASALGYADPFIWRITDSNDKITTKTSHFAAIGVSSNQISSFCNLSHLSIANVNCNKTSTAGDYATNNADNAVMTSYSERIVNYYTSNAISGTLKNKYSDIMPDEINIQNGAEYIKISGPLTINTPINRSSGTLVIEVDGHLTIDQNICLGFGICEDISGDTIDDWQDYYSQNTNNTNLSERNKRGWDNSGTTLSNLPQIILIAESISISSEVSQVDAWLVTHSSKGGYDGGYVNTCKEFQRGNTGTDTCWKTLKINGPVITSALLLNRTGGAWTGFSGDVGNPAYEPLRAEMEREVGQKVEEFMNQLKSGQTIDPYYQSELDAFCYRYKDPTSCWRRRLKKSVKERFIEYYPWGDVKRPEAEAKAYRYSVNFSADKASIAANELSSRDLTCDGSITPAEIFDLHPLTYLWAYGQSLANNQALITYAQELAPRY